MNESIRRLSKLRRHSLSVHAVCNRWNEPSSSGTSRRWNGAHW